MLSEKLPAFIKKASVASWDTVVNNMVITASLNITIKGGFELTYGKTEQAIAINGSVSLEPESDSCLCDLDKCSKDGFLFRMRLKFDKFMENVYYLASGGENTKSYGVSMFYKYGKLMAAFTTKTKAWYVGIAKVKKGHWLTFELSWNNSVASVYVDGGLAGQSELAMDRGSGIADKSICDVFLGKATTTEIRTEQTVVEIEEISVYTASWDVLLENKVVVQGQL